MPAIAFVLIIVVAAVRYGIHRADQRLRAITQRFNPSLTEQEIRDELERISHV